MSEEWFVRVEGKEYGPVEVDALREWRREGRLIRENEIRRQGEERWILAGELVEIFADAEPAVPPPLPQDVARTKPWRQIVADTFRIYRSGLSRFLVFGLLTSVPMFVLQWTFPKISFPDLSSGSYTIPSQTLSPISVAMLAVVLLVWPVSAAGLQIVADDSLRGEPRSLGAQFTAALGCWGRMLVSALLVYGSYFFWFFVPLTGMLALVGSGQVSALAALLVLLIGGFMVYINARLFINFLFWQQTTVLGGSTSSLTALRESKDLARSVPEAPRLDRPLFRGAIVASVWLLLLLVLTFGVQLPFLLVRLAGVENPEQTAALIQEMAQSQTPDALMMAADIASAAINLLLRPLLAVAFVVLYYDARARSDRRGRAEINSE